MAYGYYCAKRNKQTGGWRCPDQAVADKMHLSRNRVCEARLSLRSKGWIRQEADFFIVPLIGFLPVENSTQPVENSTQPVENSTQPVENSTQPVENSTGPFKGTRADLPAQLPAQLPARAPRARESKFDSKTLREFADHLAAKKRVHNPGGFAKSIQNGSADDEVQEWLDSRALKPAQVKPDPNCDYCEGMGSMRVREDGTAVLFSSSEDTRSVAPCRCRNSKEGH
jgi:hypothetical protein